jgi:hypothetical protein
LIDFGMATKICDESRASHVKQTFHQGFFGNVMFASETLLSNLTPGRNSDLESLLNVICVMHNGYHPMIEEYEKRNDLNMILMNFRLQNKERLR